jgi:hypothetical protein
VDVRGVVMSFLEELRSRLKSKQKDWEKCREEVRKAKERESALRDEVAAIQTLLNAEEPKKSAKHAEIASVPAIQLPLSDAPEVNKAQVVRQLIEELGPNGVTPAQLRTILTARKFEMPGNYLYAILLRAKRAGHITERNGKYYVAEKQQVAS